MLVLGYCIFVLAEERDYLMPKACIIHVDIPT